MCLIGHRNLVPNFAFSDVDTYSVFEDGVWIRFKGDGTIYKVYEGQDADDFISQYYVWRLKQEK